MNSPFKNLTEEYLINILPLLQEVISLQKAGAPFRQRALQIMIQAEHTIPGAGMHYSIIKGGQYGYPLDAGLENYIKENTYTYPFDKQFEGILRPLRYALNDLSNAYSGFATARHSVQTSGSHLEGCMKVTASILQKILHKNKTLGALIMKTQKSLGEDMVINMLKFTKLAVNPAKHDYINNNKGPVFNFEDALYAHFLARYFGAVALEKVHKIDPLIEAIQPIDGRVHLFRGAALHISHD